MNEYFLIKQQDGTITYTTDTTKVKEEESVSIHEDNAQFRAYEDINDDGIIDENDFVDLEAANFYSKDSDSSIKDSSEDFYNDASGLSTGKDGFCYVEYDSSFESIDDQLFSIISNLENIADNGNNLYRYLEEIRRVNGIPNKYSTEDFKTNDKKLVLPIPVFDESGENIIGFISPEKNETTGYVCELKADNTTNVDDKTSTQTNNQNDKVEHDDTFEIYVEAKGFDPNNLSAENKKSLEEDYNELMNQKNKYLAMYEFFEQHGLQEELSTCVDVTDSDSQIGKYSQSAKNMYDFWMSKHGAFKDSSEYGYEDYNKNIEERLPDIIEGMKELAETSDLSTEEREALNELLKEFGDENLISTEYIPPKSEDTGDTGSTDGTKDDSGTGDTEGDTTQSEYVTDDQIIALQADWQKAQDEQGIIGKAWNGIKNLFGTKNCPRKVNAEVQDLVTRYQNGEKITQEELNAVLERTQTYRTKQDNAVDTTATVGAIAAGGAAGAKLGAMIGTPFAPPLGTIVGGAIGFVIGGIAGGFAKVFIKQADNMTDQVEGNSWKGEDVTEDFGEGFMVGGSSGMGTYLQAAKGVGIAKGAAAREVAEEGAEQTAKRGLLKTFGDGIKKTGKAIYEKLPQPIQKGLNWFKNKIDDIIRWAKGKFGKNTASNADDIAEEIFEQNMRGLNGDMHGDVLQTITNNADDIAKQATKFINGNGEEITKEVLEEMYKNSNIAARRLAPTRRDSGYRAMYDKLLKGYQESGSIDTILQYTGNAQPKNRLAALDLLRDLINQS